MQIIFFLSVSIFACDAGMEPQDCSAVLLTMVKGAPLLFYISYPHVSVLHLIWLQIRGIVVFHIWQSLIQNYSRGLKIVKILPKKKTQNLGAQDPAAKVPMISE